MSATGNDLDFPEPVLHISGNAVLEGESIDEGAKADALDMTVERQSYGVTR